jgi:hypothetical protein
MWSAKPLSVGCEKVCHGLLRSHQSKPRAAPKITNVVAPTIRSEQMLNSFVQTINQNLPLDLKSSYKISEETLYTLAYANVQA